MDYMPGISVVTASYLLRMLSSFSDVKREVKLTIPFGTILSVIHVLTTRTSGGARMDHTVSLGTFMLFIGMECVRMNQIFAKNY